MVVDHDYMSPTHPGALVWAADEKSARELLDKQLLSAGLEPYATMPYTLSLVHQLNTSDLPMAQLLMSIK